MIRTIPKNYFCVPAASPTMSSRAISSKLPANIPPCPSILLTNEFRIWTQPAERLCTQTCRMASNWNASSSTFFAFHGFQILFKFNKIQILRNFLCWQVPSVEEFSPLKNPDSTGRDCLSTCLQSLHSQHGKWIRDACIESTKPHQK